MILYGAVLPSIDSEDAKKDDKKEEVINADDPANREKVRSLLFG